MADKKVSKKNNNLITKTMTFSEVLQKRPEAVEILFKAGMHCFGCSMAAFETLEQGCVSHGIDADKIVKEINKT